MRYALGRCARKQGLEELKNGTKTIYQDEDGNVSMPTTYADQKDKEIVSIDDLTQDQLQALVSDIGTEATKKTKAEIDLTTKKKKQQ